MQNGAIKPANRIAFHGLDLYSLYDSMHSVLKYLDEVDPATACVARERDGCLTPWQSDPATYGHAALTGAYPTCEFHVATVLTDLLQKRQAYAEHDMAAPTNAAHVTKVLAIQSRPYMGDEWTHWTWLLGLAVSLT